MILWIYGDGGQMTRVEDTFCAPIYLAPSDDARARHAVPLRKNGYGVLEEIRKLSLQSGPAKEAAWTEKLEFWSNELIPALELKIDPDVLARFSRTLYRLEGRVTAYNADLMPEQYYLYLNQLFPLGCVRAEFHEDVERRVLDFIEPLDSPMNTHYEAPDLRVMSFRLSQSAQLPLAHVNTLMVGYDGSEYEISADTARDLLERLKIHILRYDPHVIVTQAGDAQIMPTLFEMMAREGLDIGLDREPEAAPRRIRRQGSSYFSYGRVLHRDPSYPLFGRWHLDRGNSFIVGETGFEGLFELARMAKVPVQRMARTSTGTAMTSMEIDVAIRDGYLIPMDKARTEDFKTTAELTVSDKGGLVFCPPVGAFEYVAEIDFSQMYPTIMVVHNISPETINCACCPEIVVPEDNYCVCKNRRGIVSRTLKQILAKRHEYKRLKKVTTGLEKQIYDERQAALKWVLVTCFGYMGYRNAKFGKIEAHEAINAFGREKLLTAKEIVEAAGFEVLHGNVDSLWIRRAQFTEADVAELAQTITDATQVEMSVEGIYRWIAFVPSKRNAEVGVPNRYFGVFESGDIKARGLAYRKHDTPRLFKNLQARAIQMLATARTLDECRAFLPKIEELFDEVAENISRGRCSWNDLVIYHHVSHRLEEYKVENTTMLAMKQMANAGIAIEPGQTIGYIIRNERSKIKDERVIAEPLARYGFDYDTRKYLELRS
ncbi:MAG: DNA polymerase domain-containing protein, partial [bacterium]